MATKTIEFPNDPMMQELHDIRQQISGELKGLSPKEWVNRINKDAKTFWQRMGYEIIQKDNSFFVVLKKSK